MFLELLHKEFIGKTRKENSKDFSGVFNYVFRGLILVLFLYTECSAAVVLDRRIKEYDGYPNGAGFDLLTLFLFYILLLGIVYVMVIARRSFFEKKENRTEWGMPLDLGVLVKAKIAYLYIRSILFQLFTATPLFLVYAISYDLKPICMTLSFLYPAIISIFILGIVFMVLSLYHVIYKDIQRNFILKIIAFSVLAIIFCVIYRSLVNVFLNGLLGYEIQGVFSEAFVESTHVTKYYLIPVYSLLDAIITKENMAQNAVIFVFVSFFTYAVGRYILFFSYHYAIRNSYEGSVLPCKERKARVTSGWNALVKKETLFLLREKKHGFSYTIWMVFGPFLTYVVIETLYRAVYTNPALTTSSSPMLFAANSMMLILLFVGITNSFISDAWSKEGKRLAIVKTLPISPLQQLSAKLLVPITCSQVSLFVTLLALVCGGLFSAPMFFFTWFVGTLMILAIHIFGVYCDMHDLTSKGDKLKFSWMNKVMAVVLPLLLFLLFFVFDYANLPDWINYLLNTLLSITFFVPVAYYMYSHQVDFFHRMEVNQ